MTGVTDVVSQLGGQADWRRGGLSKYGTSSQAVLFCSSRGYSISGITCTFHYKGEQAPQIKNDPVQQMRASVPHLHQSSSVEFVPAALRTIVPIRLGPWLDGTVIRYTYPHLFLQNPYRSTAIYTSNLPRQLVCQTLKYIPLSDIASWLILRSASADASNLHFIPLQIFISISPFV